MPTVVHSRPVPIPPVTPNFGWYYGLTPTRLGELIYQEGTAHYPPGRTTMVGAKTFTPGGSSFSMTVNTPATDTFETRGRLMVQDFSNYHYAIVTYTGTTVNGSGFVTQFTGCLTVSTSTGAALALADNTPIFDPRFYVDQTPLNQLVTFDTEDVHNLGLATTSCPPGITVRQYVWDLGNGETAFGKQASTTYNFTQSIPISVTLTVTDSIGREYSVAHPINLSSQPTLYGTAMRERG